MPTARISNIVKKLAEIGTKYGVTIHCAAHAADGNVHADILKENMPIETWDKQLPSIQREIYQCVYSLGGGNCW